MAGPKIIKSLERGLLVLQALQMQPDSSLQELFVFTGISKPSLLRILHTLARAGVVTRRLADGRYRIGATLSRAPSRREHRDRIAEALAGHELDGDVAQLAERAQGQPFADRPVALAHDQDRAVREQRVDVQAGAARRHADVHIDLGGREIAERDQGLDADDAKLRVRHLCRHPLGDARQARDLTRVGDREGERTRAAGRIERSGLDGELELSQPARDRRRELARARRGDDATAFAGHQRIA